MQTCCWSPRRGAASAYSAAYLPLLQLGAQCAPLLLQLQLLFLKLLKPSFLGTQTFLQLQDTGALCLQLLLALLSLGAYTGQLPLQGVPLCPQGRGLLLDLSELLPKPLVLPVQRLSLLPISFQLFIEVTQLTL